MGSAHVEHVNIKIEGLDEEVYPISFDLSIQLNTIPTLMIELLPVGEIERKKAVGNIVKASAPTYDDMTRLYSKLLTKAETQVTKLTVTITTKPGLSGISGGSYFCDAQKMKFKDWVLTDVGLSDVTSYTCPKLTIVLCHPAEVLDRTGYIYETLDSVTVLNKKLKEISGSTLIGIMDSVYRLIQGESLKFKDFIPVQYGGPTDSVKPIIKNFRKRGLGLGIPSGYLDDRSQGLFMEREFGSDLRKRLVAALANIVAPYPFCDSTFRRLVARILPSLGLVIVPTYDMPRLEVRPFAPWMDASEEIKNGRVVSMSMSPTDPDPLIGTAMCTDSHDIDVVVGEATRTGKDERSMNVRFYVPDKVKNNTRLIMGESGGIIEDVGDSEIITCMTSVDLGTPKTYGKSVQDTENAVASEKLIEARKKYLKETFIENYRRNCIGTITTVLTFTDAFGNTLYPGRVLTVVEEEAPRRELLYGYVTSIESSGSTDGNCTTTIQMTHVRPPKDQQAQLLVDQPSSNEFYLESASL